MIENNQSHKSGAKITLCNVAIKGSPLLSHIFICTCPLWFAMAWCPSANSMCLSVSSNKYGIKYESYGVMWHVAPESKIQLVYWELSPKFPLVHFSLPYIHAIDAYIFLVTVIFTIVACTISFLIKTYLLSLLIILFWWLWKFCNKVIFKSTSKTFMRCTLCTSVIQITSRTRFYFSCLILLKHFSEEWITPPQKVNFVWTVSSLSLFLPQTDLLSRFK